MEHKSRFVLVLSVLLLAGCGQNSSDAAQEPAAEMDHSTMDMGVQPHGKGHQDHNPRHGGQFAMALDYVHHLEFTLSEPNIARVYLYDQYTVPLPRARMLLASGSVHLGEFPDPPAFELTPSEEGDYLEARIEGEIEFPQWLTLLIHFPGSDPDAEPELFNFFFGDYTVENSGAADGGSQAE